MRRFVTTWVGAGAREDEGRCAAVPRAGVMVCEGDAPRDAEFATGARRELDWQDDEIAAAARARQATRTRQITFLDI
jgi:hypothetical protein